MINSVPDREFRKQIFVFVNRTLFGIGLFSLAIGWSRKCLTTWLFCFVPFCINRPLIFAYRYLLTDVYICLLVVVTAKVLIEVLTTLQTFCSHFWMYLWFCKWSFGPLKRMLPAYAFLYANEICFFFGYYFFKLQMLYIILWLWWLIYLYSDF